MKSNICDKYIGHNENYLYNRNIKEIFENTGDLFKNILNEKKSVSAYELNLSQNNLPIHKTNIVDINPLYDKHSDIIGFLIIIKKFILSEDLFSKREQDIISKIRENKSYKEISYELNISINTVKSHIKNIYKKAKVESKDDLLKILST